LLFLKTESLDVLKAQESPIYKAFQLPELSLKIFNENLKLVCHIKLQILDNFHILAEKWLSNDKTILAKIFAENTILFFEKDASNYQTTIAKWIEITLELNAHKFLYYICLFNKLTDHTECCKPVSIITKAIKAPKTSKACTKKR
jgi:hypothetical protein